MTSPQSLGDAIRAVQKVVHGNFTLAQNQDGNALNAEEQSYLTVYNSQWRQLSDPLDNQVIRLMVALYKAKGKTSEELSQEPGLSIVMDTLSAKEIIDSSEMGKCLDGVYGLTAAIFSTPATDAEHSAIRKKQRAETQAKLHMQL